MTITIGTGAITSVDHFLGDTPRKKWSGVVGALWIVKNNVVVVEHRGIPVIGMDCDVVVVDVSVTETTGM